MPTMAATSILTSWRKLVLDSVDPAFDHDDELSRRYAMANCLPSMVGVDGGYIAKWCHSRHCPWCFGRRGKSFIEMTGYKRSSRIDKMAGSDGLFSAESRREVAIPLQDDPVDELASSIDGALSVLAGLFQRNRTGNTKIEAGAYVAVQCVRSVTRPEIISVR